ncbi:MAG: dehydrogenase [Anaerolineaceae bacterium]|nr:dehydrogenase [Anaerolineaceae bacterium]
MRITQQIDRREFLKFSGIAVGGLLLPLEHTINSRTAMPIHKAIGETPTICCFCAVGCGAIVASQGDRVVNIEGDPDHPINQGSLCSKGMALAQINTVDGEVNPRRLQNVKYRAPGSNTWEEKDWSWAITEIASRVKQTRDDHFIKTDSEGRTVNRVEAIASLGGAALDSEECALIVKSMRALGLVYIEHQARI